MKSVAILTPMLARLQDAPGAAHIFQLSHNEDGTFTLEEACDHYFEVTLSAAELAALGQELIDASKRLEFQGRNEKGA